MLGAITGDIAGSKYEFNPCNDYNLDLFGPGHDFTDDTICTIGVADAILRHIPYDMAVHDWCRRYPHPAGSYGGRFGQWVRSDNPRPYGSFGNGAAMRVSPVAWAFDDKGQMLREAEKTAAISHDHPEGIKGAQTVALAIWLARQGKSIREILDECSEFSGYDLNIDESRVRNRFDETCRGTVPVALWIIGQSNGFEDAVRRAISLGADADTLGAIVGSIAEAVWGIPGRIASKALAYLPEEMKTVVDNFKSKYQ